MYIEFYQMCFSIYWDNRRNFLLYTVNIVDYINSFPNDKSKFHSIGYIKMSRDIYFNIYNAG